MSDLTLDYLCGRGLIRRRDAAEVSWSHAVNSRRRLQEALSGPSHMIEADVILRGCDPREPVMAHPPDTDSDVTLREFLQIVKPHGKGIKLDFKSLEPLSPSLVLLDELLDKGSAPLWVNADILPGPSGQATPLDAEAFLGAVCSLPAHTVLSLGWTTGWTAGADNPGYSWDMVRVMEQTCRELSHPVTFPVRAALLASSFAQLCWLLQQSDRFSLTVWTGTQDQVTVQDLLPYRKRFHSSRIFYDLPESLRVQLGSGSSHD
ncbi:unnamed protein product [Ophioblennius macclurei]